jgi:hypothetical protein
VPDLAGVLQLLDRSERLLDRHLLVDAVQLPQVDPLDPQPSQAHLDALPEVLGTADLLPLAGAAAGQAALGRDDDAVVGVQRLPDEVLGDEGP